MQNPTRIPNEGALGRGPLWYLPQPHTEASHRPPLRQILATRDFGLGERMRAQLLPPLAAAII